MTKKKLKNLSYNAAKSSIINGQLNDPKVKTFIKLFSNLPRNEAIYCLENFKKSLEQEIKSHTLLIESASPLSNIELNKIKSAFSTHYTLYAIQHTLNPNLYGGLKIKIGDNIFDDSLSTKIQKLGEIIHG